MPDGGAGQAPEIGRIVTFYSFKGGTGRTMALANVAWILAANGKRVLIADWDLESPGLHRFFQPFMDRDISTRPGVVDFIRRYEWAARDQQVLHDELAGDQAGDGTSQPRLSPAAISQLINEHVERINQYPVPVNWHQFPGQGAIDFLTPGRQGNGVYENALSALDWDTLYDDLGGAQFFDALRARLKSTYDYVLIDSRTGLSDIADICTLHLPDLVVDCFTLSDQGIEGAARTARQIQRYSERDITIFPVPMRIERAQQANVVAGLDKAQAEFAGLPARLAASERARYWAEVRVPYLPSYAYEETLAAFGDRPGDEDSLLPAYQRIAALITDDVVTSLPPLDEWLRLRTRLLFARTARRELPVVTVDFSPQDQLWAEWIVAVLAGAGVYARLANEENAGPPGVAQPGARVIAVASEFYFAGLGMKDPPGARPELLVCVTDVRIPAGRLDDVPVLFLAERTEQATVDLLVERYGGKRPTEYQPVTGALRFPGGGWSQVVSLPARNLNFTGRDAVLLDIREQLQSQPADGFVPLTVRGAGGVGKTQVALEYAQRFKADYDIVWWLNCGQPQYIDASLIDLSTRLRDSFLVNLPGEGVEIAPQLLRYLSEQTKLRWLLVYDNAEEEDFDSIEPLLPSGGGHVLITSRHDLLADRGATLPLSVFERAESVDHLRRRIAGIDEADAYRVAGILGDVPLAVATAGALLATENITVPDYLGLLDAQPPRPGQPSGDFPETVTKAWHLSLDRLVSRSRAAYQLLAICSVMAPVISLDLVVSDVMAQAVRQLDPSITERSMINRLIRQIDQLALIKLDRSARQMQVHQVVQEVVRLRMPEDEMAVAREVVHQMLVSARPPGDVDDPETWTAYRTIWPHLTPAQAHRSDQTPVRDLLVDRVRYLRERDDLERGRRRAEEIQEAWQVMLSGEEGATAFPPLRQQLYRLQFNLANILRALGRFQESRALDQGVLLGQRELLGDDHPHTLATRSSLASDLRALGEYEQALIYDRETYRLWTEVSGFGEQYYGTLNASNNLALSYLLNGNYREALKYDQETLDLRQRTYPRAHPRILNSGSAVGRDLLEAGRYRDAVRITQDVLNQSHDAFGDDARITLNAYLGLGVALRCAGSAEQAEANIATAVEGLTRAFGKDDSDALSARLSQAVNRLALGRITEGRASAEDVLAAYEERLGPGHPHTLIGRLNIATALYLQDDFSSAQAVAWQAAEGLEQRLGEAHPYTLAAKMVLASVLARLGDLDEAVRLERLVAANRALVLGEQHPDTVRCRANLLLSEAAADVSEPAGRKELVNELSQLLGQGHPDVHTAGAGNRLLCVIDPQPF